MKGWEGNIFLVHRPVQGSLARKRGALCSYAL